MNKILKQSMSFIALSSLLACAANHKGELPQGYLATHVFDDGSKQFVYTVDLPASAGQGKGAKGNGRRGNTAGHVQGSSSRGLSAGVTAGSGGGRGGKGGRSGQGQQGRVDMLVNALEAELKESGYCRKGYMELDRMMEPTQTFIKGECTEAASDHDVERFPNEDS